MIDPHFGLPLLFLIIIPGVVNPLVTYGAGHWLKKRLVARLDALEYRMNASFDVLGGRADSTLGRLDAFEKNMIRKFDAVDVRFDKLGARSDAFENEMDARFGKVGANFDRLEAGMGAHFDKFNAGIERLHALALRIVALEEGRKL